MELFRQFRDFPEEFPLILVSSRYSLASSSSSFFLCRYVYVKFSSMFVYVMFWQCDFWQILEYDTKMGEELAKVIWCVEWGACAANCVEGKQFKQSFFPDHAFPWFFSLWRLADDLVQGGEFKSLTFAVLSCDELSQLAPRVPEINNQPIFCCIYVHCLSFQGFA